MPPSHPACLLTPFSGTSEDNWCRGGEASRRCIPPPLIQMNQAGCGCPHRVCCSSVGLGADAVRLLAAKMTVRNAGLW
jgi:hypothetical protein